MISLPDNVYVKDGNSMYVIWRMYAIYASTPHIWKQNIYIKKEIHIDRNMYYSNKYVLRY